MPGQSPTGATVTDPVFSGQTDPVYLVSGTSTAGPYHFYEYSFYNPATQTSEMLAYGDAALTQPFFTLSMNANGTYDFHLTSNSLQSFTPLVFSGVNYDTCVLGYISSGRFLFRTPHQHTI